MAQITTTNGISTGISDDGRIAYASCNDGPTIDGRWTVRGYYTNALGGMDLAAPVSDADWTAACSLMHAVDAAHYAYSDALRQADEDRAIRRIDEMEAASAVRGGAYDPNSY